MSNFDFDDLIIGDETTEEYKHRIKESKSLNEKAGNPYEKIEGKLISLIVHMLKYMYNRNIQSTKWVSTIKTESREIKEILSKSSDGRETKLNTNISNIYLSARKDMLNSNPNIKDSQIPLDNGEFILTNITNEDYINNFLVNYSQTYEVKKKLKELGLL